MATFVITMVLVLGINTMLWASVGLARAITRSLRSRTMFRRAVNHRTLAARTSPLVPDDVAVVIAARNEEQGIADTVRSAARQVPLGNIFVVSDGSVDTTAVIARDLGANVLELAPNRGKAGALQAAIDQKELAARFAIVLLLDADTELAPDYLATGLPLFTDSTVVAVAGRASTNIAPPAATRFGRFLLAYRERFYIVVQYFLKYGQAARAANVVSIVPGFASMYRSSVLADIDITAPGLAIEDFNMTFEVHAKQLGRIEFHPRAAIAYTQDPDTYQDYTKQLGRWTLGFWQTVRRHGVHVGKFWAALTLYISELVISSLVMLLWLPVLFLSTAAWLWSQVVEQPSAPVEVITDYVPPLAVLFGVLIPDYLLTVFAVIVCRRREYLLFGLGFPLMRLVDAAICIWTIPQAFSGRSSGKWRSPVRRGSVSPGEAVPITALVGPVAAQMAPSSQRAD